MKVFLFTKVFLASLLLLYVGGLTGCDYTSLNSEQFGSSGGNDEGRPPHECSSVEPNTGASLDIIDFQKVKTEVFDPHCLRCHNPGRPSAGIDLSTYASVKARLSQIDFAVARNVMPPSGPLDPVKKGYLSDWIKAGAPEGLTAQNCTNTGEIGGTTNPTGPSNEPLPGEPPLVLTQPLTSMPSDQDINFTLVKERIFAFHCLSCHSDAGGNRDGVNLETYERVYKKLDDLEDVIRDGEMPPRSRPALSLLEKNVLLRWVRLGAPK